MARPLNAAAAVAAAAEAPMVAPVSLAPICGASSGVAPSPAAAGSPVAESPTSADGSPTAAGGKLLRSKIASRDFSKFDIYPQRILKGEDSRTTVMVRNLLGTRARQDFLGFLDACGLGDRYTFFYMPCKEHREVRAGFAFVNFKAPSDVHTLHVAMSGNLWQQRSAKRKNADGPTKPLAMSYARCQGHDELAAHFSASVVIHEKDPEKRPIFRTEGREAGKSRFGTSTPATTAASTPPQQRSPTSRTGGGGGVAEPESPGPAVPDDQATFREALQKGIRELSALIAMEQQQQQQQHQQQQQQLSLVPKYITGLPPGLSDSSFMDSTLLGA